MTPPNRSKKTALELAEERRLAAMSPEDRDRLEAARQKLRARADAALNGRHLGGKYRPPIEVPHDQITHDLEELL